MGANAIALADVNKDGKLDMVVSNFLDYSEVLVGNGDGTFSITMLGLAQRQSAVALADLNGDGLPELLTGGSADSGSNLSVFLNANAWATIVTLPATTTTLMSSAASITAGQSLASRGDRCAGLGHDRSHGHRDLPRRIDHPWHRHTVCQRNCHLLNHGP